MGRIRGSDTKPECLVRSLLHRMGFRFRLHRRDLPGTPDIVLPRRKSVIFVHGCFWHRHKGCSNCTTPTHNRRFWARKLERNAARDQVTQRALRRLGWRVLVVWECETEAYGRLAKRLRQFLSTKTEVSRDTMKTAGQSR